MTRIPKKTYWVLLLVFAFWLVSAAAPAHAENVGDVVTFNVNSNFDTAGRIQVQALLVKVTSSLYFYVDKDWWLAQAPNQGNNMLGSLDALSMEFVNRIYPDLTSTFGTEWRPGIDNENRITVFFHPMRGGASGYFKTADEYSKLQIPESNEREMVYLNADRISDPDAKVFLAHEFMHLIAFNQKDRASGISDETWLNEARADFSSTILGYDKTYEGSNLQRRVKDFLSSPSDPLLEWRESRYDYSVASLFTHYLVDHYGVNILVDSLKSKSVGVASINEALQRKGVGKDFAQVFTDWSVAAVLNDCSLSPTYCYFTDSLSGFRMTPVLNFLPLSGSSSLTVTNRIKNWSGSWQKIIGGNGDLTIDFKGLGSTAFKVPYVLFNKDGSYALGMIKTDTAGNGSLVVKGFGDKYNSLIIIPSLQSKSTAPDSVDASYSYSFTASIAAPVSKEEQDFIDSLLAQIDSLKKQIAALQAAQGQNVACSMLPSNLALGMSGNDVRCLQQFLKNQSGLYPEGLTTGYFGGLTRAAVMRFQGLYAIPQTGFVGPMTRTKINSMINAN